MPKLNRREQQSQITVRFSVSLSFYFVIILCLTQRFMSWQQRAVFFLLLARAQQTDGLSSSKQKWGKQASSKFERKLISLLFRLPLAARHFFLYGAGLATKGRREETTTKKRRMEESAENQQWKQNGQQLAIALESTYLGLRSASTLVRGARQPYNRFRWSLLYSACKV